MRTRKVELTQKQFPIFDSWCRGITDTEFVAERLRQELEIAVPSEYATTYRVQPKLTGAERRAALCYQSKGACEDIHGEWDGRAPAFFGIDLLEPVRDLADADSITLEQNDDLYLWVYTTPANQSKG